MNTSNRKQVDLDFQEFRTSGDPHSISKVFDAASGELFALARKLTRDSALAEDLVQDTFLVAIQRADRWNPKRPVIAWLVGILVKKAHKARKKSARLKQEDVWHGADAMDGFQYTLDAEVREEVRLAIQSLSAKESELLTALLDQEQKPVDLAREAGITPGAMRVRIHRAMDKLRNVLPASLAWSLAGYVGLRGHQAIRNNVVLAATANQASLASVPLLSSATRALGSLSKTQPIQALLVAGVAVVGTLGLWRALGPSSGDEVLALNQPIRSLPAESPEDVSGLSSEAPSSAVQPQSQLTLSEPLVDESDASANSLASNPNTAHKLFLQISGVLAVPDSPMVLTVQMGRGRGPQMRRNVEGNGPMQLDISELFTAGTDEIEGSLEVYITHADFVNASKSLQPSVETDRLVEYHGELHLEYPKAHVYASVEIPAAILASDCIAGVLFNSSIGQGLAAGKDGKTAIPSQDGQIHLALDKDEACHFFLAIPGYLTINRSIDFSSGNTVNLGQLQPEKPTRITGRAWVGDYVLDAGTVVLATPTGSSSSVAMGILRSRSQATETTLTDASAGAESITPWSLVYAQSQVVRIPTETKTDADGRFELNGLEPGLQYDLHFRNPKWNGQRYWHHDLGYGAVRVTAPAEMVEVRAPLMPVHIIARHGRAAIPMASITMQYPSGYQQGFLPTLEELGFVAPHHGNRRGQFHLAIPANLACDAVINAPGYAPFPIRIDPTQMTKGAPIVCQMVPDGSNPDVAHDFILEFIGPGASSLNGMEVSAFFSSVGQSLLLPDAKVVAEQRVRFDGIRGGLVEISPIIVEDPNRNPREMSYARFSPRSHVEVETDPTAPGEAYATQIEVLLEGRIELTLSGFDPSLSPPTFELTSSSRFSILHEIWAAKANGTGHHKVSTFEGAGPFYLNKTIRAAQWTLRQTNPQYEPTETVIKTIAGQTTSVHVDLVMR